jgi:hypothetical protein
MANKESKISIWSYIGKAGVLVALFWGVIQIYNNFFSTGEYEANTRGHHSFYETAPEHYDGYIKSAEYRALVQAIIEDGDALKNYNLDSLLKELKESNRGLEKMRFERNLSDQRISPLGNEEYRSIWEFSIKNNGKKPFEELVLELPFKGYYKVILPNNVQKSGRFNNRIEIGELRPSYEASVYCWSENILSYTKYEEDKSRFTHKNGWFGITYPVEATGLYAWNERSNNAFLMLGIMTLLILLALAFVLGEAIGKSTKSGARVEANEESN